MCCIVYRCKGYRIWSKAACWQLFLLQLWKNGNVAISCRWRALKLKADRLSQAAVRVLCLERFFWSRRASPPRRPLNLPPSEEDVSWQPLPTSVPRANSFFLTAWLSHWLRGPRLLATSNHRALNDTQGGSGPTDQPPSGSSNLHSNRPNEPLF